MNPKRIAKLLSLLTTSVLISCSQSLESKKSNVSNDSGPGRNHQEETSEDVTDYSKCNKSIASSPIGRWKQSFKSDSMYFDLTIDIRTTQTLMSNTCYVGGRRLAAKTTVASRLTSNTYEILQDGHDSFEINENNFRATCQVNAQRIKMNYGFEGGCLVLSQPGNSTVLRLIPTN